MSEALKEIDTEITLTQAELETTLKDRAAAEQSIADAEGVLAERKRLLQTVLDREGNLRGKLGELKRARAALTDDG